MIIKSTVLILFFISIFFLNTNALAESKVFLNKSELSQLEFSGYENINPNLIVYPFERYRENLVLLLTINSVTKKQYIWNLYNKRFRELIYIINFDKTGFLLETVDRYNTFSGKVKIQYPVLNQQKKNQVAHNLKLLEKLRDRYHSGSAYWSKIQQAVDTTRSLI